MSHKTHLKLMRMIIKREFDGIEIKVTLTDEELVNLIANKNVDERVVFFRKLFETDLGRVFPFSLAKTYLNKEG